MYNIINIRRTDDSLLHTWGETSVLTLLPVLWQRKRVACFLAPSEVCLVSSPACLSVVQPQQLPVLLLRVRWHSTPSTLPLFTCLDISPLGFFNPN